MGQSRDRRNPHGWLGALAGFNGQQQRWAAAALAHLETQYNNDPHNILKLAEAAPAGLTGEIQLRQLGRDYAAFWLLQRFDYKQDPTPEQQQALWERTLSIPTFRTFDLVHAAMGWDITTLRVGVSRDTAAMRFAASPFADELEELLAYVPVADKKAYLALRNRQGFTAVHTSAHASTLAVLAAQGASLEATTRIEVAGCKMDVTIAHLAVLNGRVGQTLELVRLQPELFKPDKLLDYTPMEAGQMQLEDMLEGYGRKQFSQLIISAFTAIASKGELNAVSQVPAEQQDALAQHYANIARCVNIPAHVQGKPLPYPEHADVLGQLVKTAPVKPPEKMGLN